MPADVAVLIISSLITLLALSRALLPFEMRKRKKGIGWGSASVCRRSPSRLLA